MAPTSRTTTATELDAGASDLPARNAEAPRSDASLTSSEIMTKYSFEFFPPRTDKGRENLQNTWRKLAVHAPEYFSVTFGAGGSTMEGTFDTVKAISEDGGAAATPHISCISATREGVNGLLQRYREVGINRLVVLRGDVPSGMYSPGEFRYANELVSFIRAEHGQHFHISVAAYPEVHPQAKSASEDLDNFVRKVEAGADVAITQYFFNADGYFDFLQRARQAGVNIPIVPGIMPITNYAQLARFSDACGAEIPRWLRLQLADLESRDAAALAELGQRVVSELCQRLIAGGVDELHFYTLNKALPSQQIIAQLS